VSQPAADVAVILAAGAGGRLAGAGGGTPKPLLPLDGRPGSPTFLDWHVRCLAAARVGTIYVVGNACTYGAALPAVDAAVRWISNPTPPEACGSAASALVAWTSPHAILDGRSRVLLMDADIVYDPALLALLGSAPDPRSKLLVCDAYRETGEEVLVFGDPEPRRLGKGLAGTPHVAGYACLGEATGIMLWEPGDHAALRAATAQVVETGVRGARSEHEDATQLLLDEGRVAAILFGGVHAFLEVDTPEDYARLTGEIAPRLRLPAAGPPTIAPIVRPAAR
jgi:choline kinase